MTITTNELVSDFEKFARENNYFLPPGRIAEYIDKATPLRFSRNGGHDTDCFAYLHKTGIGTIADWHDFQDSKTVYNFYKRNGYDLSDEEREAIAKEAREMEAKAKEQAEKTWREKAKECFEEFRNLPKMESPLGYFARKGFEKLEGDIRVQGEIAVVPFFDGEGLISTLQDITPEGIKRWRSGAKKGGSFFPIGLQKADDRPSYFKEKVYICEGVATGLSVYLATGTPTIVAGDVGNLLPVSRLFRNSIIVADHDVPSHTGEEYAKKTGKPVIVVKDSVDEEKKFDADDFRREYGLEALGDYINDNLPKNLFRDIVDTPDDFDILYIIKDWLQAHSVGIIYGKSQAGKSFISLDLALSVALGLESWAGGKILERMPVAYLCGEGQEDFLKRRVNGWFLAHGYSKTKARGFFNICTTPLDISNHITVEQITCDLQQLGQKPGLIILDTLECFMSGDYKDSKDAQPFLNGMKELSDTFNACVLAIGHVAKGADDEDPDPLGSTNFVGNVDIDILVQKLEEGFVKVRHHKNKGGTYNKAFFKLEPFTLGPSKIYKGEDVSTLVPHLVTEEEATGGEKAGKTSPRPLSSKQKKDRAILMCLIADQWLSGDEGKEEIFVQKQELSFGRAKDFMVERFSTTNPDVPREKISKRVTDMMNPKRRDNMMHRLLKYGYVNEVLTDEDDRPAIIKFYANGMNTTENNTIWLEIRNSKGLKSDDFWRIAPKGE